MSSDITIAIINLVGALIAAIISAYATVTAAKASQSSSSNVNLPQKTRTSSRNLRILSLITGGISFVFVITGILMWINRVSEKTMLTINDIRLDNNLLKAESGSDYKFDIDKNLIIKGIWYKPVWINYEIPNDFSITVKFKLTSNNDEFILGIGDNNSVYSGLSLVLNTRFSQLRSHTSDDHFNPIDRSDPKVESNRWYTATFERKKGELKVLLENRQIFSRMDDVSINTPKYIYITSHGSNEQNGVIIVSELEIKEFLE